MRQEQFVNRLAYDVVCGASPPSVYSCRDFFLLVKKQNRNTVCRGYSYTSSSQSRNQSICILKKLSPADIINFEEVLRYRFVLAAMCLVWQNYSFFRNAKNGR